MGTEINKYLQPDNNDAVDDEILLNNSFAKEINKVITFFQIFNPLKKEDLKYYGLIKSKINNKEAIIELVCLSPKFAFKSIKNEKPRLLLMTSGTLAKKEIAEKLYDLEFRSS